jgi:hypothetical protein
VRHLAATEKPLRRSSFGDSRGNRGDSASGRGPRWATRVRIDDSAFALTLVRLDVEDRAARVTDTPPTSPQPSRSASRHSVSEAAVTARQLRSPARSPHRLARCGTWARWQPAFSGHRSPRRRDRLGRRRARWPGPDVGSGDARRIHPRCSANHLAHGPTRRVAWPIHGPGCPRAAAPADCVIARVSTRP